MHHLYLVDLKTPKLFSQKKNSAVFVCPTLSQLKMIGIPILLSQKLSYALRNDGWKTNFLWKGFLPCNMLIFRMVKCKLYCEGSCLFLFQFPFKDTNQCLVGIPFYKVGPTTYKILLEPQGQPFINCWPSIG